MSKQHATHGEQEENFCFPSVFYEKRNNMQLHKYSDTTTAKSQECERSYPKDIAEDINYFVEFYKG